MLSLRVGLARLAAPTSRRAVALASRPALRAAVNGAVGVNWHPVLGSHRSFAAASADGVAAASLLEDGELPRVILDPLDALDVLDAPPALSEFDNLRLVSDFALSDVTTRNLQKAGITHLFPIQAASFDVMVSGADVIGRSKTGSGKTLAFALPIVERLLAQPSSASSSSLQTPRAIVLLPTRELAQQVATETKRIAPQLRVVDVVGGVPYGPQESSLRRGVDILVGTPGRIMDLVEKRRVLSLREVQVAVLDEADMMLKFGFQEAVETILGWMPEDRQTAMWSATFPKWVNSLATRFTKDAKMIDLVGQQDNHVPDTVTHKAIHAPLRSRVQILVNVLRRGMYGGKTLVFTETKQEANEIANALDTPDVRALHGDLSQAMRQQTMDGFRKGNVKTLVCTDIAARGLDIANVDLVVQFRLPHDKESFVHRAGRTGRAGRSGTNIVFFDNNDAGDMLDFEKRYKVAFKHSAPPQLNDVLESVVGDIEKRIQRVPAHTSKLFEGAAARMLDERGVDVLSQVLALLGGLDTNVGTASMLTGRQDMQTVEVTGFSNVVALRSALSKFDTKYPIRNFHAVDGKLVFDIELHSIDRLRAHFESIQGSEVTLNPATELSKVLINSSYHARSSDNGYGSPRQYGDRRGRDDFRGRRDYEGRSRNDRSRDFDAPFSGGRGRDDRWKSSDRKPRANNFDLFSSSDRSNRSDRRSGSRDSTRARKSWQDDSRKSWMDDM